MPDEALARIDADFTAECARFVEESWLHHEPELIRRGTNSVISMGPESLRADYLSARDHDLRGKLGEVDVPAMVISGESDPLVPTWLSEELADELPGASLAIIAETAHVPQLERPEMIDLLIAAFLARLELSMAEDA